LRLLASDHVLPTFEPSRLPSAISVKNSVKMLIFGPKARNIAFQGFAHLSDNGADITDFPHKLGNFPSAMGYLNSRIWPILAVSS
jgi:hypothetical protein